MKKRHPFFLLEVLIAVILVGGFAYLLIHRTFGVISKEKKLLKELANSREEDIKRMDLIAKYWSQVASIAEKGPIKDGGYTISSKEGKKDKYYLLEIKKRKTFSYYVANETSL
jgi:type II secretory pathway pseudopilin PulG